MRVRIPTLRELDCDDDLQVCARVHFQDWVTTHYGAASPIYRDALWRVFKRGMGVAVVGGEIYYFAKAQV